MELTDYERNKMADMYEMVRLDEDKGSIEEMLLSNKYLLDREINIMVFHDCPCLGMFEKPIKTHSVSKYSSWIRSGRCQCEGNPDESASLRLLHIAAALGDLWLTNILLDQGCDVCTLTHHFHHSALHLAVYNCETEVMNTVVQRAGGKLRNMNNSGLLQVLIIEKPENHLSMLKLLIDSGACVVNECDELNQRSLETAIEFNDIYAIELLLSKGADPNLPDCCGNPMLNKALYGGNMNTVKSLLAAGADVNASCDRLGYTSLICAFSCQFHGYGPPVPLDIIHLLLESGADPNAIASDGHPTIYFTFDDTSMGYMKLLLSYGGDVNITATNYRGYNALHTAAFDDDLDILIFLLNKGALPDVRTKNHCTPLSLASNRNNLDCMEALLKYPVNVNNMDVHGDTPLHAMAFIGNVEGVVALLDHGANPDIVNTYKATPLWNAVYMGHCDIVHLLAHQNVTLEISSCGNDQFLYDDFNSPYLYNSPHSVLWVAVDRNFPKIVNFLVEIGYNIWMDDWLVYGDNQSEGLSHSDLDQLIEKLEDAAHTAPSLMWQCRNHFRKNYRGKLLSSVISQCRLPVSLKDYILLQDVPCPQLAFGLNWI